ncbi:fatty acyl-AMP ligase [Nakamurella sp. A5-74]|uniref:Fatty acyl-AMP ligase n=1 Tax=Nakamurella sp. A5-74 TaxID=3158264 RepID=A0AAU8DL13_9ACTN
MSRFITALADAAQGGQGITLGTTGEHRSWAGVRGQATTIAGGLTAMGLEPGAAVAILAGSPVEIAPAAQAVWMTGASVTMLHQPTARTDLRRYADDTAQTLRVIGASAVIVGEPFTEAGRAFAAGGVPVLTMQQLLEADPATDFPEVREDSTALLQLTSGSTATPKAVRITHANLWANLESMCQAAGLTPGTDVMVSWLPLFHDMGMVGFLTLPMCRGIDLVTVTPTDFLRSPVLWPQLISHYRGTCTAAPNFAYAITARTLARLTRDEADLDLSSLRFALNGAEPIDVAAVEAFLRAGAPFGLPATAMVCAYGMAEATLGVSFHPWGTPLQIDRVEAVALEQDRQAVPTDDDASENSVRSFPVLGPPLPGIEVQVRGADGEMVPERKIGTLMVRGDAITELYLTVEGPVPTRGADGWLDTGDIGYLIDGRVVVCGRQKDVIIMGGRNIHPTDIERIATSVEGVRAGNAAAVGWRTSGGRESFAVVVESRSAGDEDAARGIADAVRSAVTSDLGVRPARVVVLPVGGLPKTPSGKIKRAATAALLRHQD